MPVRTVTSGPRFNAGGELRITLGLSGDASVQDGYASIMLDLAPNQHWRLRTANGCVDTAPTGENLHLSADYSDDGGVTWTPLFSGASGANVVIIPDGAKRSEQSLTSFFNAPAASDLEPRYMVRANIDQIGSSTPGTNPKLILKGDVWAD